MGLNVREADPQSPAIIFLYGIEGSGKTSFGASAPAPIFAGPEGGIDHIAGAKELTGCDTWENLRKNIRSLITEKHDFKTLVLDSADWIEKLAHAHIIKGSKNPTKSIVNASGGYGAGYRESENLHRELIDDLKELQEKKKMHLIILAHYHVRTVKDPEAVSDYEAFEIKCHEMVSSLWREYAKAVIFVRFKTFVKPNDEKTMAFGTDERVAYTVKRPAFQAKNRYDLPAEMEFTKNFWQQLEPYILKGDSDTGELKSLQQEVLAMIGDIVDAPTQEKAKEHYKANLNNARELKKAKKHIQQIITKG